MMNLFDIEKIIHLLNEGNHGAFERVYKVYSDKLYRLAMQYLKSPVLADDALQYVFMKLWEGRRSIDPKQNLWNFLFTILKNYLVNTLKAEANETERYIRATKEILQTGKQDIEEKILFEKRLSQVYALIAELPFQKKQICELKLLGYSNKKIAVELNISENTVKSHYQTALNVIREKIKK